MNVYKYDELTKEYTGVETAQLDPLESKAQGKNVWLLPANATFVAPLVVKEGYTQVLKDGVWNYVEDNRGKEYWLLGDEYGTPARVMKELGALPGDAVFEAPEKTLEQLKTEKHNAAGAAFATKRDAIRFIEISDGNTYGFDCANEDITNFFANKYAAEKDGQTEYKVWLTESTKGLIVMKLADFDTVFDVVSKSQKEAYKWYGEVAAAIEAATTKEELEAVVLE